MDNERVMALEFNRGEWKEIPFPFTIPDGIFDWNEILKSFGYTYDEEYFDQWNQMLTIYEHKDRDAPYRYFCDVALLYDSPESVFVPDFPSLMMLCRDLSPFITMRLLKDVFISFRADIEDGYRRSEQRDIDNERLRRWRQESLKQRKGAL